MDQQQPHDDYQDICPKNIRLRLCDRHVVSVVVVVDSICRDVMGVVSDGFVRKCLENVNANFCHLVWYQHDNDNLDLCVESNRERDRVQWENELVEEAQDDDGGSVKEEDDRAWKRV